MKVALCLLLTIASAVCASAKDLDRNDGTSYKDVEITERTPIGLSFICHGKAGWLDFRDMAPEMQREYGYDPAKADEFERELDKKGGDLVPAGGAPDMQAIPAEANLDPQTVPQNDQNTTVVAPGQQVLYDPAFFTAEGPVYNNRWVLWNGHHYPYYWWHNWYWGHHWVYSHGRYYPWHYFHGHGTWYHGKYYPYHHGLLDRHAQCHEREAHGAAHHPQAKDGEREGHAERSHKGGGEHHGGGHAGGGKAR